MIRSDSAGLEDSILSGISGVGGGASCGGAGLSMAVDFDGVDDYAQNASITWFAGTVWTLAGWLKVTISGNRTLFSVTDGTNNNGVELWAVDTGPTTELNPVVSVGGVDQLNTPDGVYTLGSWHAFTMRRDGSALDLFIDGVKGANHVVAAWPSGITDFRLAMDPAFPSNRGGVRFGSLWASGVAASDATIAAWAADPQSIPSYAHVLTLGESTDTFPTLTDSGSTGGWDLTCNGMVAGDFVEDYPV